MKTIKNIFLIDDDFSTSRFHQIVIERLQIAENITFAKNGKQALNYLLNKEEYVDEKYEFLPPELIFVDLNMPVMDGFRFVELFTETEEFKKYKPQIVVLSTSLIPEEKEKIKANKNITKFLNKPLTKEILSDFLLSNF